MTRALSSLIAAGLLASTAASAAPIAITNATAMTGRGEEVISGATILIDNGRITAIGAGLPVPAGASVVDARGRTVTPGIIAAAGDLSVSEVGGVRETNDGAARQSDVSAALDLASAVNPRSIHFAINRMAGITRAAAVPDAARTIFGGQGALINLSAAGPAVTRARAFQYMEMGQGGARLAGGSRPAAWAQLANMLGEAQRYAANPAGYTAGQDAVGAISRADAEALSAVLAGRQPLMVHAERASDIEELLKLKGRYPAVKLVLVGAREAWLVAPAIARAGASVITHSLYDLPDNFESLATSRNNVGILRAAGVTVAIAPLGGVGGTQPFNLPAYAGNVVAQGLIPGGKGLSRAGALATITSAPARILGLADTGTLEAGKRADVVLWEGDPLELASAPVQVWIDGVAQPLTSRQTELAQRYKALGHDQLPLQYPH